MKRPAYIRSSYLTSIAFAVLPIGAALYAASAPAYDLRYLVLALGLSAVVGLVMAGTRARQRPTVQLPWFAGAAVLVAIAVAEVAFHTTTLGPPAPMPHFRLWAVAISVSWAISYALDTYARFDGRPGIAVADA